MMGGIMEADPTGLLLRMDKVREELKITSDQEEALKKLGEQMRPSRPEGMDFRSMSEEERNEFFQKMRGEVEKKAGEMKEKLEEVLFPEQTERLGEIVLQRRGVQALNDPEIAKELSITDAQKKELEEVRETLREEMSTKAREMFANRGEGGDPREAFAKLREDMETKILAVLTDEQRTHFDEMKGEPFEMPEGASMFGGYRGGDRGGERGGDRPRRGRPE
jgi:Spy/CpxP family protein refolding chaperone